MGTKTLSRVEVKDEDKGEITAVFATLGVVDHDGDVTVPGAFEDGAPVRISAYGHASWGGVLPVGKGTIRVVKDEAILSGGFFMDTQHGADTFRTVKALAELGEWSYGYDVTKASFGMHEDQHVRFLEGLKVHEVSPVLLGAGIGTRTLGAKSALRFTDEATQVLRLLEDLVDRAADVRAMRAEKGKTLGEDVAQLLARVKAQGDRLVEVLAAPAADDPTATDAAVALRAELERELLRAMSRRVTV